MSRKLLKLKNLDSRRVLTYTAGISRLSNQFAEAFGEAYPDNHFAQSTIIPM